MCFCATNRPRRMGFGALRTVISKRKVWGCLILPGSMVIAVAVCLLVLAIRWDVLVAAPRVATASFLSSRTLAACTMDFTGEALPPFFKEIASGYAEGITYVLPHECTAFVETDPGGATRTASLAISPRHLGPLLASRTRGSLLQSRPAGIEQWTTQGLEWRNGALFLSGTGPILQRVPAPIPPTDCAQALEGGHLAELVISNQSGLAEPVLDPIVRALCTKLDEMLHLPLSADELMPLVEAARFVHMTVNLAALDAVEADLRIEPDDRHATAHILQRLQTSMDKATRRCAGSPVNIAHELSGNDSEIRAHFRISGLNEPIKRRLRSLFKPPSENPE